MSANSFLFYRIGAANRDPDIFIDPNNFILERKRLGKTGTAFL
ncbi:hypothetical protein [Bartonella sp. ML70XJBT.G]|nr:hypothetical protein [Bartonella sp. ML70XJBT.G]